MSERPFNVVRREDLTPLCPHCNERITEVYYKAKGPGWFLWHRAGWPSAAQD